MTGFADDALLDSVWRLFAALACGLLIGAERERRKNDDSRRSAAGLRTFALTALLGGLAAQSGLPLLTAMLGLSVGVAMTAAYWFSPTRDPDITTEVALLVAFALGVLTQTQPVLSMASAVVVTVLLAFRQPLHRFLRDTLTEREMRDGLLFFVAAVVVLPLMPNRAVDPWGLVNPFTIWRLAVVLMAVTAMGYAALRLFGTRYGLTLAGFASGLVSSSATIAAMGGRARANKKLSAAAAAGGVGSMLGSLLYLIVLVAATNVPFAWQMAWPFGAALAALLLYAGALTWSAHRTSVDLAVAGRAFDPKVAVIFAGLVAIFALVATGVTAWLGEAGALASAVATGLVDVQAAAVSLCAVLAAGRLEAGWAPMALVAALTANMLVKVPLSFATGTAAYGVRVSFGIAALLAGLWAGYAASLSYR